MPVACWFSLQSLQGTPSARHHKQSEGCPWDPTMGPSWSPLPLPLSQLPFSPFTKERSTSHPSESHCGAFPQGEKKPRTPNKGVIQDLAVSVEKVSDSNDWVTNPFQFFAFNKTEEGSDGVVSW